MSTLTHAKVKSSAGTVHYAETRYKGRSGNKDVFTVLCGHRDYFRGFDGYEHEWPETDEPVTCKRCLKMKLLGQLRDTKFHARIIHNDVREGVELTLEYAEGNLLRTLISQGYIKKIPKKGEQIEITIWGGI